MPQDLDPRFATDANSARVARLVFRSLTLRDEHQRPYPDLALDWRLEEPLVVSFRLREDAVFHDGTRLTADDVRATYESILDPATGSPKREELSFLDAVDAPDRTTVRFRMKEPYAPFLEAADIGVLPARAIRGAERVRIGSGPFRITSIEPDHEVRLDAVPGHGGLTTIRFRVIPDDTVRALEMKRGTVALVENAVEPETLRWLAREPAVCVSQIPGTTFQYLGMNFRDPTLARREVRRAIALAIDRDALVTHLLGGTAEPASGLLSPAHWAFEGDVTRHRHHPAEARRLLDAAGFPDPDGDGPAMRLRLSYKTTTLDSRRRIAEALQAELAEVGIGLDIRSFEWGTFYDDIRRGDFQLYALAWVGVSDPDIYRSVLASDMTPPRGNNRGAYRNDEIDRLTQLGRTTLDPLERRRIYGDVQRLTAEDLPFVPLWWTDNVVVQDRRLCGFVPYPDGDLVSLRTAWWNDSPAPAENGRPSPCGCAAGAASRGEPPRE